MSFSSVNGYVPATIEDLMLSVMVNVNAQFGTAYTQETFIGTNFYKYFYAAVQKMQENEIKTAEIFVKLQDYFSVTNEMISRPTVTAPGLIDSIETTLGKNASVKPPINTDAGKIFVCVDTDDDLDTYPATKLAIANILKSSVVGGVITQGTEVTTLVLTNGQSFDYKFFLPTVYLVKLRLTITLSDNNQFVVGSPDDMKIKLLQNIAAKYRLGKNFEPQRYFTIIDAPWAESVKLEWSIDNGSTWNTTVYNAAYNEKFEARLENIQLIEN
jgi:hypothetical protein